MSADRFFSVFSSFSQRDSNTLANSEVKKNIPQPLALKKCLIL